MPVACNMQRELTFNVGMNIHLTSQNRAVEKAPAHWRPEFETNVRAILWSLDALDGLVVALLRVVVRRARRLVDDVALAVLLVREVAVDDVGVRRRDHW